MLHGHMAHPCDAYRSLQSIGPGNHKKYPKKTKVTPLLCDSYRFFSIQGQKTIKNTKKNQKNTQKKPRPTRKDFRA